MIRRLSTLLFRSMTSRRRERFYGGLLGCPEGRSAAEWIDFDFFGHQIVAHLEPACGRAGKQSGRWPRRAGPAFRCGAPDGGVAGACRPP